MNLNFWKLTGWFILIITISVIAYDIIARVHGTDSTISEFINFYAGKYPSLLIGGGFVFGYGSCHLMGAVTTTWGEGH